MSAQSMEDRLAAVEAELARLKEKVEKDAQPWWKEWVGAFRGDPDFAEAMKLGKKWRDSDKPKRRTKGKKRR